MSQQPTPTPRLSVSTASSHPHSHAGPSQQGSGSIGRRPQGARRRGVAAGLYVANPDNSDEDAPPGQSNSPVRSQSSPTSHAPGHGHGEYRGLPTIPQSSSVPSLQSQLQVQQSQSQTPPLPPPQPDRHARRAFTTPLVPDAAPHRPMDTRHTSLSAQGQAANSQSQVPPPSPSRMRHALPSPPTVSSPSMQSHDSRPLPLPLNPRMSSPEETLSPMTESSMSTTSLGATSRARSGSFNTSAATKRLLQVTTDNEQFTLVDITGMNTAEAIRDRIFSKLRFRDDEYSNLSLQQTEYGEDPDPNTLSNDQLCQLCLTQGDSKATLKFLVIQGVPSSSAAVVPPADINRERPIVSPIRTDLPKQHSHSGSIGSEASASGDTDRRISQFRKSQASSTTRSPHTSSISSSSFIPTPPPPHVDLPEERAGTHAQGRHTPTFNPPAPTYASTMGAGPSVHNLASASASGSGSGSGSRNNWGLGLQTENGNEMDPETAALIAQLQLEDQAEIAKEEARRKQLQDDEEMARKEQQSEAQEWHAMQHEQEQRARLQMEQIARDEDRARELAAEERRIEQEGTFRSESTYRAPSDRRGTYDRAEEFANDRRNRREQWSATGRMARGNDIDDWARDTGTHQYPSVNPLFQSSTYQSPPTPYTPEVPTPAYRNTQDTWVPPDVTSTPIYRANPDIPPTGFNRGYSETAHAQGRLNDQSLQEVQGRRNTVNPPPIRRQDPARPLHPYSYSAHDGMAPGARSMESLRPYTPTPGTRPQYTVVPRSSGTPQVDPRNFPQPSIYRTPSAEHAQDGRYPDPARTNSIPFPSPQPRGSATWNDSSPPSSGTGSTSRRPNSRPSSLHDSPPLGTQSQLLPRRPNTLHDHSPPESALNHYRPDWQPQTQPTQRSASAMTTSRIREVSPTDPGPERLPYERSAHTESWLSVPGRHDSGDTTSSSGMSEVTVVPQRSVEDENSNDTARQKDWTAIMGDLIGNAKGPAAGIAGGTGPADEEEEATLFLPPSANSSLSRRQVVRSPPSKPMLTVDTRTNSPSQPQTDSATDSETETGGSRVQRGKSFARPEPGQWHTRPEPEQLYDRLDKYFPKVDLDQPIVDNPASTPSTPGESGPTTPAGPGTGSGLPPPPVHPSRAPTSATTYEPAMLSPRTENVPRVPPVHPSRFNKAENRKSIRVMADHKRKTLLKNSHSEQQPKETSTSAGKDGGKDKDEMKLSRRMSMWGHRVVEVTASKLNLGQIPFSTPESPAEAEDSKPQTLNWVKGELIGKGSYGRVYIALNISTGDMMAVKQVELPATERDRNDRKQLGQIESLRVEIALLKDMYHPNIVAYLGFETSPEYLSIFLEYVPGGTIATIYRTPGQARFEADLVKYFTEQILEGLEYLHRKHIWHRDLKGDNILVDLNGVCKISDFGISKQTADAYDSFGQATNMKGSVFWMAPEVLHTVHNDRSYSGKVDIWSLGCVVIEMWSGKRPWGDLEQIPAMMQLFKREKPPLPNDVHLDDNSLNFLNTQCLALDPKDRPTANELLHHPFITSRNPKWSFKNSKIGKNVANTTPKTMSTTASAGGTGASGTGGTLRA